MCCPVCVQKSQPRYGDEMNEAVTLMGGGGLFHAFRLPTASATAGSSFFSTSSSLSLKAAKLAIEGMTSL